MDSNAEEKKLKRRTRKPLAYCTWMTKRPGLWFGLTLGSQILLMSINFILIPTNYDILPVVFDAFPMAVKDDITYRRLDAWQHRNDDDDVITRFTVDDIGPTWSRGYAIDAVTLYYTADDETANVFQKNYLEQMEQIEESLFSVDEYQTSFCQLDSSLSCMKPTSVVRYFDGTYVNISSVFYDPNFDNIDAVLYEASTNPDTKDGFQYFLAQGSSVAPDAAFSYATRSALPLGWPLEGAGDDEEKYGMLEDFLVSEFGPILEAERAGTADGLEMCYISVILFVDNTLPQALKDMMLAIGSLFFILIVMWIQTRSFWITGWALASIITSFWITNLIYRTIINYAYFGYFQIISIFIALGIGADDIFLFFNTWKASGSEQYPSLAHRMSDCYRRASGAMFFTSFTTMMAFLMGGMSPILPLGSFGIFTGLLIAVNYVSVIVFFPNVLIMHHVYFERRCCCCRTCSCPTDRDEDPLGKSQSCVVVPRKVGDWQEGDERLDIVPDGAPKQPNVIVRFFGGPYFTFVTHSVTRWVIICIFVIMIGFFIWSATRIEASSEPVMIYRETTNFGKAMALSADFVPTIDNYVVLYLVWGLQPTDTSSCHYTDWKCAGVRKYDETFNMNTPPAQKSLQNLCYKLKYNLTSDQEEKLRIMNKSESGELAVDCFLDNMYTFTNLSYPVTQNNVEAFMGRFPDIYQPQDLPEDFYRYFEIGVSYWMTNAYTMLSQPDFFIYDKLIGEAKDPPYTQKIKIYGNESDGSDIYSYYGTKLKYVTIQVNLSLPNTGLGHTEGIPIMNNWEAFLNDQLEEMDVDLQGGFQVTNETWHWLVIQQKLEKGAWVGIGLGLIIAFPVLVLATMNILVGFFATILIVCVTASVLGIIPLAGWKIDVMVSMNLTLLVGLSVDYIVHLAEGYYLSEHSKRLDKIQDMLQTLGISVIMGAITTLGAAVFMLFAKIMFFFQFGLFLFCIIGFSTVFSLMLFPAVMSLIGPEGNTGNITIPFKALHYKRIGRHKDDVTCDRCRGKGFCQLQGDEHASLSGSRSSSSDVHEAPNPKNKPQQNGLLTTKNCLTENEQTSL